jgi:hypothetical protein
MTTEKITLNVGDRLYRLGRNNIEGIYVIDRVTAKTAWANTIEFRREVTDPRYIMQKGADKWSFHHFELESPELMRRARLQSMRKKCADAFEKLAKACESADEETLNKYLQFIVSLEK